MVPLAAGDSPLVNREGNETDKKEGGEREAETEGREGEKILRFSEVFRQNRGIIVP